MWRCFVQQKQSYGSKYNRTERSRSDIKVIRKGHRFVESALRLLLLNKHKKCDDDCIARFCCSGCQLHGWKKTPRQPLTESNLSVNNNIKDSTESRKTIKDSDVSESFNSRDSTETKNNNKRFRCMNLLIIRIVPKLKKQ